jgi:hypothetical protein
MDCNPQKVLLIVLCEHTFKSNSVTIDLDDFPFTKKDFEQAEDEMTVWDDDPNKEDTIYIQFFEFHYLV